MALSKYLNRPFVKLAIGFAYVYFYDFIYCNYLVPIWGYMGSVYNLMSPINYFIFLVLGALPLLFYRGLNTIAAALSLFTYWFIYVPMIETVMVANTDNDYKIVNICILCVCMVTFFLTDKKYIFRHFFISNASNYRIKIMHIEIVSLLMFFVIVVFFSSHIQFVNFFEDQKEMYEQRALTAASSTQIMGYILTWLKGAFFPLLLIYYAQNKKHLKLVCVISAYIVLFMVDKSKMTFLIPFIMLLFLRFMRLNRDNLSSSFHAYVTLILIGLSLFLYNFLNHPAIYAIAGIFIMRTLCVESWIFNIYIDFFASHDYTYYTHINIVNFLTGAYPFKMALGQAVTYGGQNANASFLITDGFAAMGCTGFFIASMCFIVFKSIMNSIDQKFPPTIIICMCLPAIMSMLNVSLFTAIFSCGFMWLYILLMLADFQIEKNEKK